MRLEPGKSGIGSLTVVCRHLKKGLNDLNLGQGSLGTRLSRALIGFCWGLLAASDVIGNLYFQLFGPPKFLKGAR